jgi:hypothetical protein
MASSPTAGIEMSPTFSCGDDSCSKVRTVRLVHCGDGVVEECDEDIAERSRLRREQLEHQIDEEKRLEMESVSK